MGILAIAIPALIRGFRSWMGAKQQNEMMGWQDNQARQAWELQEKRRRMLGQSVFDLLERRPDLKERIPQPLLDWIMRPTAQWSGQRPTPSPFAAGLMGAAEGGAQGYFADVDRSAGREPVGDIPDLFGDSDTYNPDSNFGSSYMGGFFNQSEQPVQPPTPPPLQAIPDSFGQLTPPDNTPKGALPSGWPSLIPPDLLASYFRGGAGP